MTPEELRLGDTVTTAEWRGRYQSQGICWRDYPHDRPRRAKPATEFSAGVLAGTGEAACTQPLGAQP